MKREWRTVGLEQKWAFDEEGVADDVAKIDEDEKFFKCE